jgi:DsbC/DsbD-like thiol-disulfide interchange protein
MKIHRLLLLFLLLLPVMRAAAQGTHVFHGQGLTVTLVADVKTVQPGRAFYAGLFIQHEHGRHTYWKNPGLAGVATQMDWTLPQGWKAGEIQWPEPEKVKMLEINTHGYEKDTLLQVLITPPADVTAQSIALTTKAKWMCCGQTCHPGFTDLTLTLPVAAKLEPSAWADRMSRGRELFPVKVSGWKFSAVRRGRTITLSGQPEKPGLKLPEAPQFLSSDNLICSHPVQEWKPDGAGFTVQLTMADAMLPKDQRTLRGLLMGKGAWNAGDRRAVEIAVPVVEQGLKVVPPSR